MSYLAPPTRQRSRTHARDKVLTPFRTRPASNDEHTDQSDINTASETPLITETAVTQDSAEIRQQAWSETAATGTLASQPIEPVNSRLPDQRFGGQQPVYRPVTGPTAVGPVDTFVIGELVGIDFNHTAPAADNHNQIEMRSADPTQRGGSQRIPIIVENYDSKVTKVTSGSSMTSSVSQSWLPMTAQSSSSSSSSAATAAAGSKGPTTAMKPAPGIRPAVDSTAPQHHVTSPVVTSSVQQSVLSSVSAAVRQSRPFSPTTRVDDRPWSPRHGSGTQSTPDHEDHQCQHSTSSINFVPGSNQPAPAVQKFTPAGQRSLSSPPSINPQFIFSSTPGVVVRVPYVPTVGGVVRSGGSFLGGGNGRVLPPSLADHAQLDTSQSSTASGLVVILFSFSDIINACLNC